MKKLVATLTAIIMAVMIISVPSGISAEAAGRVTTLRADRTYNTFDITGDKKADTFLIRQYGSASYKNKLRIFVNGKVKYTVSGTFYTTHAKLITLKNGKRFLFLYCECDNYDGPIQAILRYNGRKFIKTVDFNALSYKHCGHMGSNVTSVSGNTVNVSLYMMSWTTGPSKYTLKYNYSNGKLVQKSSAAAFTGAYYDKKIETFTVNKNIKVYRSPGSSSVSFTLRKGNKIKILKSFRISSKRTYYRIKYGNKTGWILGLTAYPGESNKLFSNVFYAG